MTTERLLAEIEKGQQIAGHFPSPEAMEYARRIIDGEMTLVEAKDALIVKYRKDTGHDL